jgi:hypothetical protein
MRQKPITIAPQPLPPPAASDVRAASFNEDQVPAENSFLGKYYRPNRNVRTQGGAPPVTPNSGGKTTTATVVTQAQPGKPGGPVYAPSSGAPGFLGAITNPTPPPSVGKPGGPVYAPKAAAPSFLGALKNPVKTGKTDKYRTDGKWVGNKDK